MSGDVLAVLSANSELPELKNPVIPPPSLTAELLLMVVFLITGLSLIIT